MAETEVSKEVSGLAVSEAECGQDTGSYQDPLKINHLNQASDLDNSYVFVSGDDDDDDPNNNDVPPEPEVVESPAADSDYRDVKLDVEGGEFSGLPAQEVNVDEDQAAVVNDNSLENKGILVSDDDDHDSLAQNTGKLAEVEVENLESEIVGSELIDGLEVCRGFQDVVAVGVAERELQDPSVGRIEEKVKLERPVAENAGQEASLEVDLDKTPIDVVKHESQDVGEKAEDEAKVVELKVSKSTSVDVNLELISKKSEGDVHVVEEVVEHTLQDTSVDNVRLSKEVLENGEHGIHSSTSFNVDSSVSPVNSKEDTDVVECKLQDNAIKLSGEVIVESSEREVPLSVSLDLEPGSYPTSAKEEADVSVDVDCESRDENVTAANKIKLLEVLENGEWEASPSTLVDLGSNLTNTKEKIEVVEETQCETVETRKCEVPLSTSLDLDLESFPIVECELQDVGVKEEDEVNLSNQVSNNSEHEVPLSVSLDSEAGLNPTSNKEEAAVIGDVVEFESQDDSVTAENKIKLSEVIKNGESEATSLNSFYLRYNLVNTKEKIEVFKEVEREIMETAKCEVPLSASLDLDSESSPIVEGDMQDEGVKDENEVKLSEQFAKKLSEHEVPLLVSLDLEARLNPRSVEEEADVVVDVVEFESRHESVNADNKIKLSEMIENGESEVTSLNSYDLEYNLVNTKEKTEVVKDVEFETVETAKCEVLVSTSLDLGLESYPIVECEVQEVRVKTEHEVKLSEEVSQNSEHEVPSLTSLDLNLEMNPVNSKEESKVAENVIECDQRNANVKAENKVKLWTEIVEIEQKVPSSSSHVTLESEVRLGNVSATSSDEKYSGDATSGCRTEASHNSNVDKEGATNIELETEIAEDLVDQNAGASGDNNENLVSTEDDDTGDSRDSNTPLGYSSDMIHREEAFSVKTQIKLNYLIRVPKFDDESLKEQIKMAKLNIDEKTKARDAIQVQIQEKRANNQIHDYEYAKGEGRNARKLVRSKRMEIDSLQAVINKAKNALSIEDIDSQIYNMERMIQHETLALKEEKQLIREIKQLKQLREQLSSNMGSQDEIKQALEQREEVEERLKVHRKELDVLKDKVLKAEAAALEAEKKYKDENKKIKELQAQFRVVDEVRQAAYAQWQSLRKELSKKSQHFFKYRNDAAIASQYAFSGETESLYRLCTNNVEDFMELWNTNDEFRREYVKFNVRSTVRRFGTLDGRSLGPGEDLLVLPSYSDERANNNRVTVQTPSDSGRESQFTFLEPKQERTTVESIKKKVGGTSSSRGTDRGPVVSLHDNGSSGDVSSEEIVLKEVHVVKRSREEVEAAKKAEEKERAETEERLKEQRRLEAVIKAHEARERKKRQAEKVQMRVELKTLKEAEQKEKEREKRLRKKERKKAAATDVINNTNGETAQSSESAGENSKEIEVKDVSSVTVTKKAKKHWLFGKQGKAKPIPPPLRNRNKKKLQQWMWVGITCAAILLLFWLGNIGVFSNVNIKRRTPII